MGEYDSEIFAENSEWIPWIDTFLALCGGETGDFLHFPFHGSYFEQPSTTMTILKLIQVEYRKSLRARIEAMRK